MTTDQFFGYTNSDSYEFNNVRIKDDGVSLFDSLTGIGGIDYIPNDGDTVSIFTGPISAVDGKIIFNPSLNNKIYYLVSNIQYLESDKATILSLATEIDVYLYTDLSGVSRYKGDFIFSNPNEYEYIYLIWDYTSNMESGTASYNGGESVKGIEVDFGQNVGVVGINYNIHSTPSRVVIYYNESVIADSGYVGLNSTANYNALIAAGVDAADIKLQTPINGLVNNGLGSLRFLKLLSSENLAKLLVISPLNSS